MTAIKSHHSRLFEQAIAEHRLALLESMVNGLDSNTYWRVVGEIRGLDVAVKFSDDADYKISGAER